MLTRMLIGREGLYLGVLRGCFFGGGRGWRGVERGFREVCLVGGWDGGERWEVVMGEGGKQNKGVGM